MGSGAREEAEAKLRVHYTAGGSAKGKNKGFWGGGGSEEKGEQEVGCKGDRGKLLGGEKTEVEIRVSAR